MATLCLLITYHWHGSWAVSGWPSGRRLGIAAEVNGSPTDARLNIPVVKRSSNQAAFANELLPLPPRRPVVVIASDNREKLVEYLAVGLFEPTQREYETRTMEKSIIPMIHMVESSPEKMTIERTLDHSYGKKLSKWDTERKSTNEILRTREEAKKRRRSEIGIKSLISGKDAVASVQSNGQRNPWIVMSSRRFLDDRWLDYQRGLVLNGAKREQGNDRTHLGNSKTGDIDVNKGTAMDESAIDGTGQFDTRGTRDDDTTLLTRGKRHTTHMNIGRVDSPWLKARKRRENDIGRIDSPWLRARKRRENDEKTLTNNTSRRLPGGSSLVSASKFSERVNAREDKNNDKPSVTSLGIPSSIDVTKLLVDSSRLHQQSRNTKPRTIVQHLRGYVNRRTRSYGNSPISSRNKKFYETEMKHAERRQSGKIISSDLRDRRQSLNQQRFYNFERTNENPNQLRFIPFYNYNGKNSKIFGTQSSSGNTIKDVVTLAENGELTTSNIADLPSIDEKQIENLGKSLSGVFDRHVSAKQRNQLPNVRAILPKRVYIAPPRVIYDTKILPGSQFPYTRYFPNSGNNVNSKKHQASGSPINGGFDREKMEANSEKRPTIPVTEEPEVSVTSSENFVTPLPTRTGQVSFRVNQSNVPRVSTFPGKTYQVREPEEMENPSTVREYEKIREDEDEQPPVNHKSPIETRVKDHTGNVRSSYDNSASTYASNDEADAGNVDHSTVMEAINDEHPNHQTTRHGDVSNIELGVTIQKSQRPGVKQRDENYDRGSNKWRGQNDNDRTRYVAKYSFGYIVDDHETQNDFGHQEMRDEGITKGRYHVRLPDGRTQKVNYQVDDNGYHAIVSYRRDKAQ